MGDILTKEDIKDSIKKNNYYGFKKLSDNEYKIMDIVSVTLPEIDDTDTQYKEKSLEETIFDSFSAISLLDKKYVIKLSKLKTVLNEDLEINDCKTLISFYSDGKKMFNICNIMISNKLDELSKIWLSHEYIHALKDTNFNEFKSKYITSEVLPIFFELILAHDKFIDIHDKWKHERLRFLAHDNEHYIYGRNNEENEEDINDYIVDAYGHYLLGYYYALNLYNLYKLNPKPILKGFKKVLDHKMTTMDLLTKLNLNEVNNENIKTFVYEHKNL